MVDVIANSRTAPISTKFRKFQGAGVKIPRRREQIPRPSSKSRGPRETVQNPSERSPCFEQKKLTLVWTISKACCRFSSSSEKPWASWNRSEIHSLLGLQSERTEDSQSSQILIKDNRCATNGNAEDISMGRNFNSSHLAAKFPKKWQI